MTVTAPHDMTAAAKAPARFCAILAGLLAVTIISMLEAPRLLGYTPGITGLVMFIAYRFSFGTWPAIPRRLAIACGGIVLLAGVSALWSVDPGFAVERTLKILLVLGPGLLLVAVLRAVPYDMMRRTLPWIGGALAATILLGAGELMLHGPLYRLLNGYGADQPFFADDLNRSMIAITLLLPVTIALMVQGVPNPRWRILALMGLGMIPVLLLTHSQSTQLGLMVAAACLILPLRWRWIWAALFALLAAAVIAAPFIAPWMYAHGAAMLAGNPITGNGGGYAPQRLEIWDAVARQVLDKPFIGHGVEALRHIDHLGMALVYNAADSALHPHNFALQFWLEFGAVGAASIITLLGLCLHTLYKHRVHPSTRWLLPGFAATVAVAAMTYGIWQGWWLGLVMLELALAGLVLRAPVKPAA